MLLGASISTQASQLSIDASPAIKSREPAIGPLKPSPETIAASMVPSVPSITTTAPVWNQPTGQINFSADPTDSEISSARILETPLYPSSRSSSPGENRELAAALLEYRNKPASLRPLNAYLADHPESRWNATLRLNVALVYRREARWSEVIPVLEDSWNEIRNEKGVGIVSAGDRVLGELTQMHARLGHYERLGQLLAETKNRDVRGAGTEYVRESREGLWLMLNKPDEAFRCGPLALARIYSYVRPGSPIPKELEDFKSSSQGTSLSEVQDWSQKLKLQYQMAFRERGSDVIAPSVIHWRVGHFSALLPGASNSFISRDATFRSDDSVSKEVIDDEASGYFLVRKGSLPAGWREVSDSEAKAVFGKGDVGEAGPAPCNCDQNDVGGDSSDGSCPTCSDGGAAPPGAPLPSDDYSGPSSQGGGMTSYSFEPASVTLNLKDTPVGYMPPYGPWVRFTATYSHREVSDQSNVSNLGDKWSANWISYIQINSAAATVCYGPGGGQVTFTGFNGATGTFAPQLLNQNVLQLISNNSYVVSDPDGSREIYNLTDSGANPRVYRTESIDSAGNAIHYGYDASYRLVSVQDAIGQVSQIAYGLSTDPANPNYYRITRVTDPFGRHADFSYNAGGQLTGITDVLGINSSFIYGSGDFVTSLTTPYGSTTFTSDDTTTRNGGLSRSLEMKDPLGGRERVEWDEISAAPFQDVTNTPGVGGYGANVVPIGYQNSYLVYRNTFYWDKEAMMEGPGDYNKARILHWLHDLASNNTTNGYVLESTKAPLEGRVWRSYDGQASTIYEGTTNRPNAISRVLDNGTTQTYKYQYNGLGNVTQTIDPVGRIVNFVYDSNQIDLLHIVVQGSSGAETNASYTYNSQHNPLSFTDASGQVTRYTYNSVGEQLSVTNPKSETTSFSYDANGYLQSVTGPSPGAIKGLTYDSFGRIRTVTEPDSYAVTTDYDAADRPIKRTYPDGTFEQRIYKLLDLQWSKDRIGNWTLRLSDALRHLVAIQDPLLGTTLFEHCTCGALLAITDADGHRTGFGRDLQKRLVQKSFQDGTKITLAYEATTSRLHSRTDQNGQVKTMSYGLDDAIAQISYSNTPVATPNVTFVYDRYYPRISAMTDGIGTTTYSYYPVTGGTALGTGSLQSVSGPLPNSVVSYTYDELGRRLSTSTNGTANTVTSGYDPLGRIVSVTNNLGSFVYNYVDQTDRLSSIAYPNGMLRAFTYYPNASLDASGNGDRRLASIATTRSDASNISSFQYTYDEVGEILEWDKHLGTGIQLPSANSYDAAGQLVSTISTNAATNQIQAFFYSYDLAGNRLQEQIDASINTSTIGSSNQYISQNPGGMMTFEGSLSEPATVTLNGSAANVDSSNNWMGTAPVTPGANSLPLVAADSLGNSISKTILIAVSGTSRSPNYDLNGNLTDNGLGQTFTWDGENRLISITSSQGTNSFVYDGIGHRSEEFNNGSLLRQWIWSGRKISEERDASGNVTKRFYNEGEQIAGVSFYANYDHLGSVRELVDGSGAIRAQYDYDPYGRRTKLSGDVDADFGFTGMYHHASSSLELAYYREYDPSLGRWLTRDPIAEKGGVNQYAYVGNDPIGKTDPLGLFRYYGHWGGPNWTGGYTKPWNELTPDEQYQALTNPDRMPIDDQDRCYMQHDMCYGSCTCFKCRAKCDGKLQNCLSLLVGDPDGSYNYHALLGRIAFGLRLGAISSEF
jgi:RHS repeat-associated protein